MKPLVRRPVVAHWESPPDAVAAAIQRAIAEQRYEDAGHPDWGSWLVRGSVSGRRLHLRLTTHSRPGSKHAYNYPVEVRGELVPARDGTQLVAEASALGTSWELGFALGVSGAITLLFLLTGHLEDGARTLALLYGVILVWLLVVRSLAGSIVGAVSQVEAVIACVGRPLTEPADT